MTIGIQEFQQLKKNADQLQREADRAEGALQQLKQKLKEEFDCSSVKQAKKMLEELAAEEAKLTEAYGEAKEKFDKKWSDRL